MKKLLKTTTLALVLLAAAGEAKQAKCSTDTDCANLEKIEKNKALIKALKKELSERKRAAKREILLAKQNKIIDSLTSACLFTGLNEEGK